ncbi:hypothetical protein [Stigmatella erecta]|uniref:Uncharacterized protein n=1 Tax=Stigmatella erecta TaxID=83460 RepID=A0A1I0D9G1_9BACT|nr:hypothetical protein [Stigmatella erecta]SET28288.1 hypothetical protein SAMN05443639_102419 [Stigmatella erecta]
MHTKKRVHGVADVRLTGPKPTVRPVGMQTMGPMLYEQIRQAVAALEVEMKLVAGN